MNEKQLWNMGNGRMGELDALMKQRFPAYAKCDIYSDRNGDRWTFRLDALVDRQPYAASVSGGPFSDWNSLRDLIGEAICALQPCG